MSEEPAREPVRYLWEWTAIGVGIVLLFFAVPHTVSSDGRVRFNALADLLERGDITTAPYSLVGPLFSAPLYFLGKVIRDSEWWCARFNTLLLAGGLAATASLFRRSVDARILRTFVLLIVAASMFPNHARDYFGEMFTAVLALVGIAALSSARPGLGWTALVLGVVNTPATLVGLLLVSVRHVRETKTFRHFVPVCVAASLILLESWIRRGHPLVTGYEGNAGFATILPYSGRPGFSYPLFFGLLSIMLSFGKGILFFAPGLLLRLAKGEREVSGQLHGFWGYTMWFLAGLIVVYAKWWAWYGGSFFGPRFFLVASLPASLAIAVKLRQVPVMAAPALGTLFTIITLSAWVGVSGAVFDQANLDVCAQDNYALELLCWYTPEFSVLWRPFVAPTSLSVGPMLFAAYCGLVYMWLSVPLLRTLIVRGSRSIAAGRVSLKTWRF